MERIQNTINYLKEVQKIFYEINGGYHDKRAQIIDIFTKRYSIPESDVLQYLNSSEKIDCITEYQNPGQYLTIQKYIRLIDEVKDEILDNEHIPVRPVPIWGTVNMFQFSAQILPPSESVDNIILLSSGMMTYALLICKVIAKSLPIKNENDHVNVTIDKRLIVDQLSPELELRFIDLMLSYLFTGEATRARQYMIDRNAYLLTTPMIVAFECFVICQEYSHYLLGHLDKKIFDVKQLISSKVEIDEIIHNWNEEISADSLGIKLTLRALEKSGLNKDLVLVGIFSCLKSFELFERLTQIFEKGDSNLLFSKTHPPAITRILNFHEIALKSDYSLYLISAINLLIDHLWKRMQITLKEINIDAFLTEDQIFNIINHRKLQKKIFEHYSVEYF